MRLFCLLSRNSATTKTLSRRPNLLGCAHHLHRAPSPRAKHYTSLRKASLIPRLISMDINSQLLDSSKSELRQIFEAGVSSVLPHALITSQVRLLDDSLVVNGVPHPLGKDVYLVGFGKAVAGMALALERLLGTRLKRGIVSVPRVPAQPRSGLIEYREAARNNQPDEAALRNTRDIVELARGLGEGDSLVVLVSGGGSALLFEPRAPLSSEDKQLLCRRLQNAGASITELNCVRQRLSSVKGGGLARIAYPAKVLALVLSDIVGDPLRFIASGPTCPVIAENCPEEAADILKKYKLFDELQDDVKTLLSEPSRSLTEDKELIEEGKFKHVENIIIGSNTNALRAAAAAAIQFHLDNVILSNTVEGDVKDISIAYAKFTRCICRCLEKKFSNKDDFIAEVMRQKIGLLNISQEKLEDIFEISMEHGKGRGMLLLAGGEPTVVVQGGGIGGRNQELALRFSLDWLSEIAKEAKLAKYFVLFLSGGTDGQDGPTDAAGAFGRPALRPKMIKIRQDIFEKKRAACIPDQVQDLESKLKQIEHMLPENVLKRNDSYSFYSKVEGGRNLLKTGLTGTNVMDLHFIYIKRREGECDIQELPKINGKRIEECGDFLFDESLQEADPK